LNELRHGTAIADVDEMIEIHRRPIEIYGGERPPFSPACGAAGLNNL